MAAFIKSVIDLGKARGPSVLPTRGSYQSAITPLVQSFKRKTEERGILISQKEKITKRNIYLHVFGGI